MAPFGQPRAVSWLDWNGADGALGAWAVRRHYDVVWFSHCHTWLALGGRRPGPAIVDLDNLEDEKLRTLIDLRRLRRPRRSAWPTERARARRLHSSIGSTSDAGAERNSALLPLHERSWSAALSTETASVSRRPW